MIFRGNVFSLFLDVRVRAGLARAAATGRLEELAGLRCLGAAAAARRRRAVERRAARACSLGGGAEAWHGNLPLVAGGRANAAATAACSSSCCCARPCGCKGLAATCGNRGRAPRGGGRHRVLEGAGVAAAAATGRAEELALLALRCRAHNVAVGAGAAPLLRPAAAGHVEVAANLDLARGVTVQGARQDRLQVGLVLVLPVRLKPHAERLEVVLTHVLVLLLCVNPVPHARDARLEQLLGRSLVVALVGVQNTPDGLDGLDGLGGGRHADVVLDVVQQEGVEVLAAKGGCLGKADHLGLCGALLLVLAAGGGKGGRVCGGRGELLLHKVAPVLDLQARCKQRNDLLTRHVLHLLGLGGRCGGGKGLVLERCGHLGGRHLCLCVESLCVDFFGLDWAARHLKPGDL